MNGLSKILGGGDDSDDEFDEKESGDLELHVRQCGRRYRALDRKLDLVLKLISVLCILYALSNYPTVKVLILGR